MIVLPGSTVNITWSFNDALSDVVYREWRFTSSDGPFVNKRLARIVRDGQPQIEDIGLSSSGVSIIKPATLLLKNVNQTYDGIYTGLPLQDLPVIVFLMLSFLLQVSLMQAFKFFITSK